MVNLCYSIVCKIIEVMHFIAESFIDGFVAPRLDKILLFILLIASDGLAKFSCKSVL